MALPVSLSTRPRACRGRVEAQRGPRREDGGTKACLVFLQSRLSRLTAVLAFLLCHLCLSVSLPHVRSLPGLCPWPTSLGWFIGSFLCQPPLELPFGCLPCSVSLPLGFPSSSATLGPLFLFAAVSLGWGCPVVAEVSSAPAAPVRPALPHAACLWPWMTLAVFLGGKRKQWLWGASPGPRSACLCLLRAEGPFPPVRRTPEPSEIGGWLEEEGREVRGRDQGPFPGSVLSFSSPFPTRR